MSEGNEKCVVIVGSIGNRKVNNNNFTAIFSVRIKFLSSLLDLPKRTVRRQLQSSPVV